MLMHVLFIIYGTLMRPYMSGKSATKMYRT